MPPSLVERVYARAKAHRWLGQIASLRGGDKAFEVYLLLGAPQQEQLQTAFSKAIGILGKTPGEKEVLLEKDAPEWAAHIAEEVSSHQESNASV